MVSAVFLIIFWSRVVNNFIVKSNFSKPSNPQKLKYFEMIFFKKNPHTAWKILSKQISWNDFFLRKHFLKDIELFTQMQNY